MKANKRVEEDTLVFVEDKFERRLSQSENIRNQSRSYQMDVYLLGRSDRCHIWEIVRFF